MRKHVLWSGAIACALLVSGCRKASVPADPAPDAAAAAPAGHPEGSLGALLEMPRAELAAKAEALAEEAQLQEQNFREGRLRYLLLPETRWPLILPVWREATFDAQAGFSRPPYLGENSRDTELAVHLARFGDCEAAAKLANPSDKDAVNRINACRYERDYPVEWTRVVALLQHNAQVRLAGGNGDAAVELIELHRQLQSVLDAKAAQGPLGATLLPRGREALVRAVAAWQKERKVEEAAKVQAALESWGEVPAPGLALKLGADRGQVSRLLGNGGEGRTVLAASLPRAFDVLNLPVSAEGAEGVLACFDSAGRLSEVLVTYRARLSDYYPAPDHLAPLLEDAAPPRQKETTAASDSSRFLIKGTALRRRIYQLDGMTCEIAVVVHGTGVGAFARLRDPQSNDKPTPLARDFGAINLDRSLEQNRLRVAPDQNGPALKVNHPRPLEQIKNPVPALKPLEAYLHQEGEHNLLGRWVLQYQAEGGQPPLHTVAGPLWNSLGPARMDADDTAKDAGLALVWEDGKTRYTLRLPYDAAKSSEFEAADIQGEQAILARTARAVVVDSEERKARIQAGRPLGRIPRFVEQLELGMSQAKVKEVLPAGKNYQLREIPGGLLVTFTATVPNTTPSAIREIIVRFDPKGEQVAELRARHLTNSESRKGIGWMSDLLTQLRKRCGAADSLPAPLARLWADLPPRKPTPVLYRWHDDTTWLTFQRDSEGIDVVVHNCPVDHEQGVPLPPLEYLPRGPEGCTLGMKRADLLKDWGIDKPVRAGDALVLTPPTESRHDALLVWFDNDRVARIVARDRTRPDLAKLSDAVSVGWMRDRHLLGWPRRSDATPPQGMLPGKLQGLTWNDDRTRVRIFWQESNTGPPRLFTEWKDFPPS